MRGIIIGHLAEFGQDAENRCIVVQEGLFLYERGLDPYDGGIFHQVRHPIVGSARYKTFGLIAVSIGTSSPATIFIAALALNLDRMPD